MSAEAVARTALGDFQGAADGGVVAFRGVRYAAPPVGELRFAPPAPRRRVGRFARRHAGRADRAARTVAAARRDGRFRARAG